MSHNTEGGSNRRDVLKLTGSTVAAATGTVLVGGRAAAHSDSCDPVSTPAPDDGNFYVYLWVEDTTSVEGDIDNYASSVESEYNDHVDDFTVSVTVYREDLSQDEIYDEVQSDTDKSRPFPCFADYIRETFYGGSFSGQGTIDAFYWDVDNWDEDSHGRSKSSGAYDGASQYDGRNPYPVCAMEAYHDHRGDDYCRLKHELGHMFLFGGVDEHGYHQSDHDLMDLSNDGDCHELGDEMGTFIDWAYSYNRVYPYEEDSVYKCKDGNHVGH